MSRSKTIPTSLALIIAAACVALIVIGMLDGCSSMTPRENLVAAESAATLAQQAALSYLEHQAVTAERKIAIKAASAIVTAAADSATKAAESSKPETLPAAVSALEASVGVLNTLLGAK